MKKIRWGLISTANINRRVIPAIQISQRGDLVAVASRSLEKAENYAKEWNIPRAFGSYDELLKSGEVDAVYIGLPNHMHAKWSIKAMEAGLHVLCEKPFALSLDEVDAMIDIHNRTGKKLAEAFMYRHHPQTKIAGDLVNSSRLGEITLVRGIFNFSLNPKWREKTDPNVRLVPEWGGGCLWDVGVYPLSFAQYIFGGPPEWVVGTQWIGDFGVDETFYGQMGYPGGGIAQIGASFRSPFHTRVDIIGTQGRLELTRPFVGLEDKERSLTYHDSNGKSELISVPEEYLYLGEIEDLEGSILDGSSNYLSLNETRDHIKTALALYKSAEINEIVYL